MGKIFSPFLACESMVNKLTRYSEFAHAPEAGDIFCRLYL